jgi:hypothetical protein
LGLMISYPNRNYIKAVRIEGLRQESIIELMNLSSQKEDSGLLFNIEQAPRLKSGRVLVYRFEIYCFAKRILIQTFLLLTARSPFSGLRFHVCIYQFHQMQSTYQMMVPFFSRYL